MTMEGTPSADSSPYREIVKAAVSDIPSIFGRLTYLAAFREPANGCYRQTDAAGALDPRAVDEILLRAHREAFEAWLCLSLEEQAADLAGYLWQHLNSRGEPLRRWMQEVPYLKLIPRGTLEAEQELFRSDFELVLRIFHDQAS